ncbi:MAG: hypothetical protein IMY72_02110 [Bacteroidetes bacterium]|nr:hypothetical protein [Bacteroidota bacterium]
MYAIEDKIQDVYTTTEKVIVDTSLKSEEKKINEYLDTVLHFKETINEIIVKFDDLNESLITEIENSEKKSLHIKKFLVGLLSSANKLVAVIKKSHIYPGIKSTAKIFFNSVKQLKEIIQDIDLKYISIPQNENINNLMSKILENR